MPYLRAFRGCSGASRGLAGVSEVLEDAMLKPVLRVQRIETRDKTNVATLAG